MLFKIFSLLHSIKKTDFSLAMRQIVLWFPCIALLYQTLAQLWTRIRAMTTTSDVKEEQEKMQHFCLFPVNRGEKSRVYYARDRPHIYLFTKQNKLLPWLGKMGHPLTIVRTNRSQFSIPLNSFGKNSLLHETC